MATSKKDQILQLFKLMDVVRPRDAEAAGIAGSYRNALYSNGILERPSRGLYTLPNTEPSEFRSIVEACKHSPNAIVCLLSALRIHDLTTQSPYELWVTSLSLPDEDDRHGLAAAIRCGADSIVTFNIKDFPKFALEPYGIEALHPDEFVLSQMGLTAQRQNPRITSSPSASM